MAGKYNKENRLAREITLLKRLNEDRIFRESVRKTVDLHNRRKSISKLSDFKLKQLVIV